VAAGEYVAVEYIESILGKCDMVEQVWVYGSSFESVLVAVVVPNKKPLERWAREQVRAASCWPLGETRP
jgi:long-chain acyl-CoA synthetase